MGQRQIFKIDTISNRLQDRQLSGKTDVAVEFIFVFARTSLQSSVSAEKHQKSYNLHIPFVP